MKIETGKLPSNVASSDVRQRPSAARPESSAASGGSTVELSSFAATLDLAEAAMKDAPEVDRARVDEIKQAIRDGRFTVDAEKVADSLISSVRTMLGGVAQS